jgi:exonuclease VII small subunit
MIDRRELINDLCDVLVRIETTIKQPDQMERKLQGARDKVRHILLKLAREHTAETQADKLVKQIQGSLGE